MPNVGTLPNLASFNIDIRQINVNCEWTRPGKEERRKGGRDRGEEMEGGEWEGVREGGGKKVGRQREYSICICALK